MRGDKILWIFLGMFFLASPIHADRFGGGKGQSQGAQKARALSRERGGAQMHNPGKTPSLSRPKEKKGGKGPVNQAKLKEIKQRAPLANEKFRGAPQRPSGPAEKLREVSRDRGQVNPPGHQPGVQPGKLRDLAKQRDLSKLEPSKRPSHQEPSRTPSLSRPKLPKVPGKVSEGQIKQALQSNKGGKDRANIKTKDFVEKSKRFGRPVQRGPVPPSRRVEAAKVQRAVLSRHPQFRRWYDRGFYTRFGYFPPYFGYGGGWYSRPWLVINNFIGWGWGYPIYYQESQPIVITPPPASEQHESSEPAYTAEAPSNQEWIPLGNFVAGKTMDDVVYSNRFVQLALGKDGTLSGVYYNSATDTMHPLSGEVDKETQQAVWVMEDKDDSPIMSTGLYNLTQDVVNVEVHFDNGVKQSWVLVRLNEEEGND